MSQKYKITIFRSLFRIEMLPDNCVGNLLLHALVQRWANYGPRAACGPWGHFVRPAGQSHIHR